MSSRTIAGAIALVSLLQAAVAQTPAEKRHIDQLLAVPGETWAIVRRSNPAIDGAFLCRDYATVNLVTSLSTEAKTDRLASAVNPKLDRMRPSMPEPDLVAYGCAFLPAGGRVRVIDRSPVPFVEAEIAGKAIRGVVSPAGIEIEKH